MISIDEYQCENDKKNVTYAEIIYIFSFIYVKCQLKTVLSMITKDTWIGDKVAKISNNIIIVNQNWCLKL